MKKNVFILFFLFVFFSTKVILAQFTTPERLAWNNLGKEKWVKVKMQIDKALRKDNSNVAARYVNAWYFFSVANPAFNIDSAQSELSKTKNIYQTFSEKERDRWNRFPINNTVLSKFQSYVDSAAFERAKKLNTEEAYAFFVNNFSLAKQTTEAAELQSEAAFVKASNIDTYQSYLSFLQRYGQSKKSREAQKRYDKLLFETYTKDKRLHSYEKFLQEYPKSPYKKESEKQIFELFTASGEAKQFHDFIEKYPDNFYAEQARDMLFHFYKDDEKSLSAILTDSLKQVMHLNTEVWLPVWANGGYGFIDKEGNEHLFNVGDNLHRDILCDGFVHDIILLNEKLTARNGKIIREYVIDYKDLGSGFLWTRSELDTILIHKSGREIMYIQGEVQIFDDKFLLIENNNNYSFYTLTGRPIFSGNWEEVESFESSVGFRTNKGWQLTTHASIAKHANGEKIIFTDYFDEVKRLNDTYLWARKGNEQTLLTNNLDAILDLKEQVIKINDDIITVSNVSASYLFSEGSLSEVFDKIEIYAPWIVVQQHNQFKLIHSIDRVNIEDRVFDTLYVVANVAVGIRNDSTFLYTQSRNLKFAGKGLVEVLYDQYETCCAEPSTYACIHQLNKKNIISVSGEQLFSLVCDKIKYIGAGFFQAIKNDKKLILDESGKVYAIADFDALGKVSDDYYPDYYISVLYKKKFGVINRLNKKIIRPAYDRNLVPYNDNILIAYKDKSYGFIDWNNKSQSKFEFEEIQYWNDSVALVKMNFMWRLYDIYQKNFQPGKISEYISFETSSTESIAIFRQDNYYGVMSNKKGILLEPTFSAVTNMGTKESPFYFTEKYIEEASVYIVIYYNQLGEQVYKQVYEEADYQNIKCQD